jgi:hypothetical protein
MVKILNIKIKKIAELVEDYAKYNFLGSQLSSGMLPPRQSQRKQIVTT